MTKEKLVKLLKRILDTTEDLGFLLDLKNEDLEKMVAIIRGRFEE
jgi:hypothetical protein